jgi:hypothetical protein
MGLRWELLDRYSAELRKLEEAAGSKGGNAHDDRRTWLVQVVADLRHEVMSPVVLAAIRGGGRTDGRRA